MRTRTRTHTQTHGSSLSVSVSPSPHSGEEGNWPVEGRRWGTSSCLCLRSNREPWPHHPTPAAPHPYTHTFLPLSQVGRGKERERENTRGRGGIWRERTIQEEMKEIEARDGEVSVWAPTQTIHWPYATPPSIWGLWGLSYSISLHFVRSAFSHILHIDI